MAVYERKYKRYQGEQTPTAWRFLILPRYVFRDVFKSRWTVYFSALSFLLPLIFVANIYLANNTDFLTAIPNFELPEWLQVNAGFFNRFLLIQGIFALALTVFIGPGLISRDLANNGLPLYLSRPFDRREYVLGKMSVLVLLLSAITWIPAFLMMLLHANFVGLGWFADNTRIVFGVFIGAMVWIVSLSLLALSASAWVKWRPVAGFSVLLVLWGGAFFGSGVINHLFRTQYGDLWNLTSLASYAQRSLLGLEMSSMDLPMWLVWVAIAVWNSLFLLALHRKIRAYEVIG